MQDWVAFPLFVCLARPMSWSRIVHRAVHRAGSREQRGGAALRLVCLQFCIAKIQLAIAVRGCCCCCPQIKRFGSCQQQQQCQQTTVNNLMKKQHKQRKRRRRRGRGRRGAFVCASNYFLHYYLQRKVKVSLITAKYCRRK